MAIGEAPAESPWHELFTTLSKALSEAASGRLSDFALTTVLHLVLGIQNDEARLLQSISRNVKAIKEGAYYSGLVWLAEANEKHRNAQERRDFIETAKSSFIVAHGQLKDDKFPLALAQYHIALCWLLLEHQVDARTWFQRSYGSAVDAIEDLAKKKEDADYRFGAVTFFGIIGTAGVGALPLAAVNQVREQLGKDKFYKQAAPIYAFVDSVHTFGVATPSLNLELERTCNLRSLPPHWKQPLPVRIPLAQKYSSF